MMEHGPTHSDLQYPYSTCFKYRSAALGKNQKYFSYLVGDLHFTALEICSVDCCYVCQSCELLTASAVVVNYVFVFAQIG